MSVSITITGTEQLRATLQRLGENARPMVAQALYQEAESIMADAKETYVPVDLGILRASGFVKPPQVDGEAISVTLGFGGAAKDYAIIQHERLDFKHRVGGAKYLERPLLAAANNLVAHLGDRIRAALRSAT